MAFEPVSVFSTKSIDICCFSPSREYGRAKIFSEAVPNKKLETGLDLIHSKTAWFMQTKPSGEGDREPL